MLHGSTRRRPIRAVSRHAAFGDDVQPRITAPLEGRPLTGPSFDGPPVEIGTFTIGLISAIMATPFIAEAMREVFKIVPPPTTQS